MYGCESAQPYIAAAPDLLAENERLRAALERCLQIAFKHEVQYWLDEPGTDAEKLSRIVAEARAALAGEED
jgi:hypothetical protein